MNSVVFRLEGKFSVRRLTIVSVWLSALLIAGHPLSADGLWWELSKGKAVANGSWNPTADLIAGDFGADAHWLSGFVPYLAFTFFGLSGLMLLKLVFILVVTGMLLVRAACLETRGYWWLPGLTLMMALLAARQAWDPIPASFDTLCLVSVYLITEQIATERGIKRVTILFLLMCLWANLGPRCVVGIPIVLSNLYRRPQALVVGLRFAVLMLAGCCLSPAWWQTPLDSLIMTLPQTFESSAILRMAGWHPWWENPTGVEAIAFAVLSVAYVAGVKKPLSVHSLFTLTAAHVLAGVSSENLPLAAVWMALDSTSPAVWPADLLGMRNQSPSFPTRNKLRTSRQEANAEESWSAIPAWQKLACMVGMCFVGYAAVCPWDGCGTGLGWGLDPRLNPDAFATSLSEVSLHGSAHCVGLRDAGLLCWHAVPGLQPFDTPVTALLRRRLREHVLITSDLSRAWQTPHRRPDGSWGGWWQILTEHGTTALIVPSENLDLIASLEPTTWKPLSLNAVSVVYGKAGDPGCARQIISILSLRQIVDRGAWTFQPASESSVATIEPLAWFGSRSLTYQSLRLAKVFRAMQMNIGALKILQAIPDRNQGAVRDEFLINQMMLGYQEKIQCGTSSELRLGASLRSKSRNATRLPVQAILNWPIGPGEVGVNPILDAIAFYAQGDLKTALGRLRSDTPEAIYARALLLLESGEVRGAQSALSDLLAKFPQHRLAIMAKMLAGTLVH